MQEQLGVSAESSPALSRLSQSPRYQKILNDLQVIEQDIATKKTKLTNESSIIAECDSKKEKV